MTATDHESELKVTTNTPYFTLRASYGVSVVRKLEETDWVSAALYIDQSSPELRWVRQAPPDYPNHHPNHLRRCLLPPLLACSSWQMALCQYPATDKIQGPFWWINGKKKMYSLLMKSHVYQLNPDDFFRIHHNYHQDMYWLFVICFQGNNYMEQWVGQKVWQPISNFKHAQRIFIGVQILHLKRFSCMRHKSMA